MSKINAENINTINNFLKHVNGKLISIKTEDDQNGHIIEFLNHKNETTKVEMVVMAYFNDMQETYFSDETNEDDRLITYENTLPFDGYVFIPY